jgi:outer membrane protein assembly factor BamB
LEADGNQAMSLYGDTLYVPESKAERLTAIDLKTMKILWRTSLPGHLGLCSTIRLDGDEFLLNYEQNKLFWIGGDGNFKGIISMPKEVGTLGGSTEFGASDSSLLLQGSNGTLWRLNPITDIVAVHDFPHTYEAYPKTLWIGNGKGFSVPYWDNGFVYWGYGEVLPNGAWSTKKHFLKITEKTGEIIWDSTTQNIGIASKPQRYKNALLGTGGGVLEIDMNGKVLAQYKEHPCSIFGFLVDKNNVFASSMNPPGNIFGISLSTGRILWTRDYPYTAEASPQVNNGILYYPLPDGTRMYRESDGEYLGVDPIVHGASVEDGPTIKYNDLLVVRSEQALWIIKMDYKLDWLGGVKR